jgi:hypothetical protein
MTRTTKEIYNILFIKYFTYGINIALRLAWSKAAHSAE